MEAGVKSEMGGTSERRGYVEDETHLGNLGGTWVTRGGRDVSLATWGRL